MDREQVREAVRIGVETVFYDPDSDVQTIVDETTDAIMALGEPMLSGLLYRAKKAAFEMRRSAKAIRGEHAGLNEVADGNEGIANVIDELLGKLGEPPTVTRGQLQAWHTRASEVPENEWVMTVRLILEGLGVNVEES